VGADFGVLGVGYLRVSYANSEEIILRDFERMGTFLSERKPAAAE
jgi:hypothetical protein